jgi:outer membrane protein assembly factor BamB
MGKTLAPRVLLTVVVLLLAAPAQASAQNWMQLGGSAEHSRHNTNETTIGTANVASLRIDWTAIVSGASAAPVTWGGIVYVSSGRRGLFAIDAQTGAQLWWVPTNQSVPGSPAVANGIVHVLSSAGIAYGFDARTGAFLWSAKAGVGSSSSPVVASGVLYTTSLDGTVHALDAATGTSKWSAPASARVMTSPAVSGGIVYVTSEDEKLHAYEAATGRGLWSAVVSATGAPSTPATSTPTVANGVVYITHGANNLNKFDARTGAFLGGRIGGCSPTRTDASPAIANGVAFVSNTCGHVFAIDAATPSTRVWLHARAVCCASPLVVANGVVYVGEGAPVGGTAVPELRALDAQTGMELLTFPIGLVAAPMPVVSNGTLYLVSEGVLYALRIFDDTDNDNVWDTQDNCRFVANPWQEDRDHDGVGDACDNAPGIPNPGQYDADGDGVGDAIDNCRLAANEGQEDYDHDAVGDACDNAPYDYNPDQSDSDGDGIPDVHEFDDDNDGVEDAKDNCPSHVNPDQQDSNGDGIGDACESLLTPEQDLRFAFVRRDESFERFQLGVQACRPCPDPEGTYRAGILIEGELPVELRLYDPRGELVATGWSGEPLEFEARGGLEYRLEVLPSPEFDPEGEYPYTAHLEVPDL